MALAATHLFPITAHVTQEGEKQKWELGKAVFSEANGPYKKPSDSVEALVDVDEMLLLWKQEYYAASKPSNEVKGKMCKYMHLFYELYTTAPKDKLEAVKAKLFNELPKKPDSAPCEYYGRDVFVELAWGKYIFEDGHWKQQKITIEEAITFTDEILYGIKMQSKATFDEKQKEILKKLKKEYQGHLDETVKRAIAWNKAHDGMGSEYHIDWKSLTNHKTTNQMDTDELKQDIERTDAQYLKDLIVKEQSMLQHMEALKEPVDAIKSQEEQIKKMEKELADYYKKKRAKKMKQKFAKEEEFNYLSDYGMNNDEYNDIDGQNGYVPMYDIPTYNGGTYGHLQSATSDFTILFIPLVIILFCIFCAVCLAFNVCIGGGCFLFGKHVSNESNRKEKLNEIPSYQEPV